MWKARRRGFIICLLGTGARRAEDLGSQYIVIRMQLGNLCHERRRCAVYRLLDDSEMLKAGGLDIGMSWAFVSSSLGDIF